MSHPIYTKFFVILSGLCMVYFCGISYADERNFTLNDNNIMSGDYLLTNSVSKIEIDNIIFELPPRFIQTGSVLGASIYAFKSSDKFRVTLLINTTIFSHSDTTSKLEAEERYRINVPETIEENQIEPYEFKNAKYTIWACGYNFCDDINKRFYSYYIQYKNHIVEFTFGSHDKYFDSLVPLFEKIVRSVEFVEPTP